LAQVLHSPNRTAGGVLNVLVTATAGFKPEIKQEIVRQAIANLSFNDHTALRSLVMSQEMKNLNSITLAMIVDDTHASPGLQAQAARARGTQEILGTLVEGLRLSQAGWQVMLQQGQTLPSEIPQNFSLQGGLTLFDNLPQATQTALTDLGLNTGTYLTEFRNAMQQRVPMQDSGNILRGNNLFESPIRKSLFNSISPCLMRIHEQLTPHLTDDLKQIAKEEIVRLGQAQNVEAIPAQKIFGGSEVRLVVLDSPQGRQFQQRMANLLTQDPMKSQMEKAIRLLRDEVKPHVTAQNHTEKMMSALTALTFLSGMSSVALSINTVEELDKSGTMLLMQQMMNGRLRPAGTNQDGTQRPADILYTALTQLQGFNELIAPPQNYIEL
jgi:hypothetical protein